MSSLEDFDRVADCFYSLSSVTRLQAIYLLARQSCTAQIVANHLSTSKANAVKQLTVLERAGWITRVKVDQSFFYSLHKTWALQLIEECARHLHSQKLYKNNNKVV